MARDRHPREQISAGLRYDVLRRCNFACYYCGTPAALGLKVLHVDHVIPVSLGGTNDPWNLVAACWDCNLGKAGLPPAPELVDRVRAEYLASIEGDRTGLTIICSLCHLPYTHDEGDEAYGHCIPCVDRDIAIYTLGIKSGRGDA
jgi:hypothetical protein